MHTKWWINHPQHIQQWLTHPQLWCSDLATQLQTKQSSRKRCIALNHLLVSAIFSCAGLTKPTVTKVEEMVWTHKTAPNAPNAFDRKESTQTGGYDSHIQHCELILASSVTCVVDISSSFMCSQLDRLTVISPVQQYYLQSYTVLDWKKNHMKTWVSKTRLQLTACYYVRLYSRRRIQIRTTIAKPLSMHFNCP